MSLEVSLLLDGELDQAESAALLADLAQRAEARDRYTIYGLIGDALRGNSTPDDGFSRRIFERMREAGVRIEADYDPLRTPPGA
jgi:negative regulator of sigma E activity